MLKFEWVSTNRWERDGEKVNEYDGNLETGSERWANAASEGPLMRTAMTKARLHLDCPKPGQYACVADNGCSIVRTYAQVTLKNGKKDFLSQKQLISSIQPWALWHQLGITSVY